MIDAMPTADSGPETAFALADCRIRGRILLVADDSGLSQSLITLIARGGHETRQVGNGVQALAEARARWPDLILLDLAVNGGGLETARRLKLDPRTAKIPLLLISAYGDRDARLHGLEIGAEDFLSLPLDAAELAIRIRNLLRLKEYGDFLHNMNRLLDRQVRQKSSQLRDTQVEAVFVLARVFEYGDTAAGRHLARIAHLARTLAEMLGLAGGLADTLFHAAALHDIGKIIVPPAILNKPGPLSGDEMAIVRRHTTAGAAMLGSDLDSPLLRMAAEIAASHHECWDGSGYPAALAGERIPLPGRIVLLCDRYDAVRSERPYKPAFDHESAVARLSQGDQRSHPAHFDPQILATFRRNHRRLEDAFEANQPFDG